jgi:hypothetical protein
LQNFVYKYYPYLDTLFYLYPDGSLTNIKDGFDFKELRSAEGGFVGGSCEYCEDGLEHLHPATATTVHASGPGLPLLERVT